MVTTRLSGHKTAMMFAQTIRYLRNVDLTVSYEGIECRASTADGSRGRAPKSRGVAANGGGGGGGGDAQKLQPCSTGIAPRGVPDRGCRVQTGESERYRRGRSRSRSCSHLVAARGSPW